MTNHPRTFRVINIPAYKLESLLRKVEADRKGILLNDKRLPQGTDSAAHGISSKKATEIRRTR